MTPEIKKQIIKNLEIENLSVSTQNFLIEELNTLIFRAVLFDIFAELKEEDKEELHEILEKTEDNFERPYNFLKSRISNIDKMFAEEARKTVKKSRELMKNFA